MALRGSIARGTGVHRHGQHNLAAQPNHLQCLCAYWGRAGRLGVSLSQTFSCILPPSLHPSVLLYLTFFLLSLFLPRTSEMPTVAALTMSLSTACAFPSSSQIPCHQRFPPVHPGTEKVIHLSISSTLFPVFLFSLTSSIFQSSLHIQFHNSSTTLS